jgi:hypothetical protein
MNKIWSDNLLEQTRNALDNSFSGPDNFLHMKNINGNYGSICLDNLLARKLLIQCKKSDAEYSYKSADELISDGWAID